jgi:chaperonin GroES
MVVEKRIEANNAPIDAEAVDVETVENVTPDVVMTEDGGAILNPTPEQPTTDFFANLAEIVSKDELQRISSKLLGEFEDDKSSRKDWEQGFAKGLDLLGFKYDERSQPFQGASGVTHPLLAESVTQFQAHAYREMLPAKGPVDVNIVGEITTDKEAQAERVKDFMNYQITNVMQEYDPEMDQLLFHLPLAGSAFKKVYYDASLGRAVSKFIPSEDLVVPYNASDLMTAERIAHVLKMSENDLRKKQVSGFYRDIDLSPGQSDEDPVQDKMDKLEGVQKSEDDYEFNLIEFHAECDIEGFEDRDINGEPTGIKLPYIITIDENSREVLSIYRNYKPNDPKKEKVSFFVHFKFLPGLGFYGFGLIHMLGGLSRTATSALRQLIDAGTLSNLPAGFKARGLRIRDDDSPIQPGEFRDVDAPGGSIREGLMPLPYKGPDNTLFQLLGFVVQSGREFASIADQKIGDGSQANPVGTTMALLERGSRVMSSIHKRLHYAQHIEFKILARVFSEYLPPSYPYSVRGGDRNIKVLDFDDRVDVIPVSDPNIFSMTQRISLAQTQLQLAQSKPEIHSLYEAYKRMYMALGVDGVDAILPPPQPPTPKDPGAENSSALKQLPFQVFPGQDHQQHINAHRAFMSSFLVKNNPQILIILQAHVSEHISQQAREEIEQKNAPLIQEQAMKFGGQLPPELLQQFQMQNEKEIAELVAKRTEEMVAEEQEYLEGNQTDPLLELKKRDLDLQEAEINRRAMNDQERLKFDQEKTEEQEKIQREKIQSNEDISQLRANVNLSKQRGN